MDWDLVIVDEAHHLRWDATDGGAAYKLVEGFLKVEACSCLPRP